MLRAWLRERQPDRAVMVDKSPRRMVLGEPTAHWHNIDAGLWARLSPNGMAAQREESPGIWSWSVALSFDGEAQTTGTRPTLDEAKQACDAWVREQQAAPNTEDKGD